MTQDDTADWFTSETLADPAFIEELRVVMLRFATQQLGDEQQAEDAVQEALIGALRNARSFKRESALKTWVFAILKHKIIDIMRSQKRWQSPDSHAMDPDGDERHDHLFDTRGAWAQEERPGHWAHPMTKIHDEHFWRVFEICLDDLPAMQSRAFMMREFLELDGSEICASLEITTSNFHVLLYRARLRLRKCLEKRWFAGEATQ